MVFFKYKSVCVGIPKTATSSLFETWRNDQDNLHGHNTLLQDYEPLPSYGTLTTDLSVWRISIFATKITTQH